MPSEPSGPAPTTGMLARHARVGLSAPICLTWELTYACNLSCVHSLSASGRRDPAELSTAECRGVLDELAAMRVFYINVGGGEPTVRGDFWELLDYAISANIGVKFSTNGVKIDRAAATRLASTDYVDVQISVDGADADVNDAIRGEGSFATAIRAMENLATAGFADFKISVVVTRHNIDQLDAFAALAQRYRAQLRLTRLRPSGRGASVWSELHPTAAQQQTLYAWLRDHGESRLTGDSFFHLSALGEALPGLNLCGAGRVVCLIDPVGDVYACPFTIAEEFKAGNVRDPGGFPAVWRSAPRPGLRHEPAGGGGLTRCQPTGRPPRPRCSVPSTCGVAGSAIASSWGRTRRTWPTAGPSPDDTSRTTPVAPAAASGSSWPRAPRCTPTTGRMNGRRWPRTARPAGAR